MKTQSNKTTLYIVYGGAVLVFFAVTAFLVTNLNSSIRNGYGELRDLDSILSSSTDTAVNVADEYFPLELENVITSYEQIATDIYRINYEYKINNTYDFSIQINNAVSYFLQQDSVAQVNKINTFKSEFISLNKNFNAVNINTLLNEPFFIPAQTAATINLQLDIVFDEGAAPVRNIIEMTGVKFDLPVSFAGRIVDNNSEREASPTPTNSNIENGNRNSTPISFPGNNPELFSGSAVSLFYPGVELSANTDEIDTP